MQLSQTIKIKEIELIIKTVLKVCVVFRQIGNPSLAKWLSVCLRTKWLWVQVPSQLPNKK